MLQWTVVKKKSVLLLKDGVIEAMCCSQNSGFTSMRRIQRGLSVFEQSDDCYCTTIKHLEERLKQKSCAQGLVLTRQIEED